MRERYSSGKMTVDYNNIDYLIIKEVKDRFEIFYEFRPKIKTELVKLQRDFKSMLELRQFMQKHNFEQLGNYFINMKNYSVIEELSFNDKSKRYDIKFYMKSNIQFTINVARDTWTAFKNSKLL